MIIVLDFYRAWFPILSPLELVYQRTLNRSRESVYPAVIHFWNSSRAKRTTESRTQQQDTFYRRDKCVAFFPIIFLLSLEVADSRAIGTEIWAILRSVLRGVVLLSNLLSNLLIWKNEWRQCRLVFCPVLVMLFGRSTRPHFIYLTRKLASLLR